MNNCGSANHAVFQRSRRVLRRDPITSIWFCARVVPVGFHESMSKKITTDYCTLVEDVVGTEVSQHNLVTSGNKKTLGNRSVTLVAYGKFANERAANTFAWHFAHPWANISSSVVSVRSVES